MITVQIERDVHQNIISFTMDGHANAGPHGKDIVCAGVSAVSFGAINAVYALCDIELELDIADSGYLRCVIPHDIDEETKAKVLLLFEGMVVSLRSIEEEYGQYVKIIDNTGGENND